MPSFSYDTAQRHHHENISKRELQRLRITTVASRAVTMWLRNVSKPSHAAPTPLRKVTTLVKVMSKTLRNELSMQPYCIHSVALYYFCH